MTLVHSSVFINVLLYYIVNFFLFFSFNISCYRLFSIAKGVQHDGRLSVWKPASVFAYYYTAC